MKRLLLILALPLLGLLSFDSYAATNIAVVDMQQILHSSPQVKQMNDDLKTQFSGRRAELMAMEKTLQADIQNYQKNKSIMSKNSLMELQKKIVGEQQKLQQTGTAFQKDLYTAQATKTKAFLNHIKDIVKVIAADKHYDLVLPKGALLYAQDQIDITSDVLAVLKK